MRLSESSSAPRTAPPVSHDDRRLLEDARQMTLDEIAARVHYRQRLVLHDHIAGRRYLNYVPLVRIPPRGCRRKRRAG